ncbi:MAG: hypothetical protein J5720_00400 [Bacteroidaceae bacterium]|nr:hypothetical protein [Bacteroidaceae bacterium]
MDRITHEIDKEQNIRIKAQGEANGTPYFYEVILVQIKNNEGKTYISEGDIDTHGIEDSFLKKRIFEAVKKKKGKHGEPPLIVDNENKTSQL